jgi:hypothetical protein
MAEAVGFQVLRFESFEEHRQVARNEHNGRGESGEYL